MGSNVAIAKLNRGLALEARAKNYQYASSKNSPTIRFHLKTSQHQLKNDEPKVIALSPKDQCLASSSKNDPPPTSSDPKPAEILSLYQRARHDLSWVLANSKSAHDRELAKQRLDKSMLPFVWLS